MQRREFLTASMAAAAANGGMEFATALDAAEAIRKKKISARELLEINLAHLDKWNPKLNAVIVQTRELALQLARDADDAQVKGKRLGPLHGVPVTVKESFAITGTAMTLGMPEQKGNISKGDAEVVRRLKNAGAVILGKTNVPPMLMDWQSANPIYGVTKNPWNLNMTPGGSTGGGAAAVAAGIGCMTMGSDIGGSIRVPAHFCGVYGHKPTGGLVSLNGHMFPQSDTYRVIDFPVAGPLARSAEDLLAALKVVGGPEGMEAKGYRWSMPAPRRTRLRDFRVGFIIQNSYNTIDPEDAAILQNAIDAVAKAGAKVTEGLPGGINMEQIYQGYMKMMAIYSTPPDKLQTKYTEYSGWEYQRTAFRSQWERYFKDFDVFVCPVTMTHAFAHERDKQTIQVGQESRKYFDMIRWPAIAIETGLPATAAPVGATKSGLPVGIQIIGPYLEDATPIEFARLLKDVVGGYRSPKL